MSGKRNPNARTTPAMRREIQQSGDTDLALAARFKVNPKTIAKWRDRTTTADSRMGPKKPTSTTLDLAQEAGCIVFRKRTRLSLDDCLARLQPQIPHLRRTALNRCFMRYGVNRIPKGQRKQQLDLTVPEGGADVWVDIYALPDDRGYMYIGITTHGILADAQWVEEFGASETAEFAKQMVDRNEFYIKSIETDDSPAFVGRKIKASVAMSFDDMHPFAAFCTERYIEHRVRKAVGHGPKPVTKGWKDAPLRIALEECRIVDPRRDRLRTLTSGRTSGRSQA
jgi:hypothetical protein